MVIRFVLNLKDENKTAFFMAVAGLVGIITGMGFGLQILFMQDEGLFYIVLPFAISALLFFFGRLCSHLPKFQIFSGPLYSFGLFINYIFIYYLKRFDWDFPLLSTPTAGLIAISLNALLGLYLTDNQSNSLTGSVNLILGTLAPLYLKNDDGLQWFFLLVFILHFFSIRIAVKYAWTFLKFVSISLTFLIINLQIFFGTFPVDKVYLFIFLLLITYSYFYFSFYKDRQLKDYFTGSDIYLLSFALFFLLFDLLTLYFKNPTYPFDGLVILLNSIPFTIWYFVFKNTGKYNRQMLTFNIACIFGAIAAIILFIDQMAIIIWSLELLFILIVGFNNKSIYTRLLSYSLLLVTAYKIIPTFVTIIDLWKYRFFSSGYINLLILLAVFYSLIFIFIKYRYYFIRSESKLLPISDEIFSFLILIIGYISLTFFSQRWISFWMFVPCFYLIYRAYIYKLRVTKILAIVLYVSLFFNSAFSALGNLISYDKIELLSTGYLNLLETGVLLLTLRWWYRIVVPYSRIKHKNFDKSADVKFYWAIDISIAIWCAVFVIYTMSYFTVAWLSFMGFALSIAVLYFGHHWHKNYIRVIGYTIYSLTILYAAYWVITDLPLNWKIKFFSDGYINLAGMGIFLYGLPFGLKRLRIDSYYLNNIRLVFINAFFAWLVVFYFTNCFYFMGAYAFNAMLILMFLLIYFGHRFDLEFTEYLAIVVFILLIGVMLKSFNYAEAFRISRQPLYLQILLGELYFFSWTLKYYYKKILKSHSDLAEFTRLFAIVVFPIIFLPTVWRFGREYFDYALWLSVIVTFLLLHFTQKKALYIELIVITLLAAGFSFYKLNPDTIALGYIVILGIISMKFLFVNIFEIHFFTRSTLLYIIPASILYTIATNGDVAGALFIISGFLAGIVFFQADILLLRRSMLWAMRISIISLGLGILYYIFNLTPFGIHYYGNNFLAAGLLMINLIFFNLIIFKQNEYFLDSQTPLQQKFSLVGINVANFVGYSFVLSILTSEVLSAPQTILMVMHGIILLFYARRIGNKTLKKYARILFLITAVKFFTYDLRNFELIEKVAIFIVTGVLFLGAAFVYVLKKPKAKLF